MSSSVQLFKAFHLLGIMAIARLSLRGYLRNTPLFIGYPA